MWHRGLRPRHRAWAGRGWDWKNDPNFSAFWAAGTAGRPVSGRAGCVEQGDLRLVILRLLERSPGTGTRLSRSWKSGPTGSTRPSPGTVYPTLTCSRTWATPAPRSRRAAKFMPLRRGEGAPGAEQGPRRHL